MHAPKLPGLVRQKSRHGKTVWYVRIGQGARLRLKLNPHDAGFAEEYNKSYAQALSGEKVAEKTNGVSAGTFGWLWAQYCQSSSWASLALSTRRQRENIMTHVLANIGKAPIAEITRKVVEKGLSRPPNGIPKSLVTFPDTE